MESHLIGGGNARKSDTEPNLKQEPRPMNQTSESTDTQTGGAITASDAP
jgi:hypothetical protein